MLKFGLACEGETDHIVIENILCGFYGDKDDSLRNEIKALQPMLNKTTRKQLTGGGWESLLKYISSKRFRQEVQQSKFMIVQIDNVSKNNLSIKDYRTIN